MISKMMYTYLINIFNSDLSEGFMNWFYNVVHFYLFFFFLSTLFGVLNFL